MEPGPQDGRANPGELPYLGISQHRNVPGRAGTNAPWRAPMGDRPRLRFPLSQVPTRGVECRAVRGPYRLLAGGIVHEVHQALNLLGIRLGQHPVPEVEDVARAGGDPREHVPCGGLQGFRGAQQRGGVEVPL